jgi:protein-tyrosine phosphatase
MIDLVCHTGLDSHSFNNGLVDARRLSESAVASGLKTIVVTAPWPRGAQVPLVPFDSYADSLSRLRASTGRNLSIRLGYSLEAGDHLPVLIKKYGAGVTLGNGPHPFVTIPALQVPAELDSVWDRLVNKGFPPIISKPECNVVLRRDPERLDRWVKGGVILQINAASVLGHYGREVQRFALLLLQRNRGKIVVASNARTFEEGAAVLRDAYEELTKRLGAAEADLCTNQMLSGLISGEVVSLKAVVEKRDPLSALLRAFRSQKPTETVASYQK